MYDVTDPVPFDAPLADRLGDAAFEEAFDADRWANAERRLLAKVLAEFAYEELVDPEPVGTAAGETRYAVRFPGAVYRFVGVERLAGNYRVRPETITRRATGGDWEPATDPVRFLLDARESLGVSEMTVGHLVREFRNTLVADAHADARSADVAAADVAAMSYAEVEGEMRGHPWITFNKGRLGWGYADYRRYAPEMKRPVRLSWLAARREHVTFETVSGLTPEELLRSELGDRYDAFVDELDARGLDPDAYAFLPVHEWQWDETITQLFAKEISAADLVPMGAGDDEYLPGQSVRTFFNVTEPSKRNVKLPMRILNTLVWRGLPGERTRAAPAVTEFVRGIRDGDPFLREECRLVLPGEVAGADFEHPAFSELDDNAYQYDELLGAVWRESVTALVDDDERPITLASLLHVADDRAVVSEFVDRSPLDLESWLDELFGTMLPPLLHYLYRYGTVFSPHGENAILVLDEEYVPARLAVKDFVDDVNVSDRSLPELEKRLDGDLRRVLRSEPPEGLCQFVFCGLFVGVYRYLADLLVERRGYDERRFWEQVRAAVLGYQRRFPELEERFETFDLLRPSFTKLCLNRNRLVEDGYGDSPGRPHAAEHGTVKNPLYAVGHRSSG